MNRRGFLQSILAAGVAPAFIGSGVLMPVRAIARPSLNEVIEFSWKTVADGFYPSLESRILRRGPFTVEEITQISKDALDFYLRNPPLV